MPSAAETLSILGGGNISSSGGDQTADAPPSMLQHKMDILSGTTVLPQETSQSEEQDQKIGTSEDIVKSVASAPPKALASGVGMWLPNLINLGAQGIAYSGMKAHDIFADQPLSEEAKARGMQVAKPFASSPEETGSRLTAGLYNTFSDNPMSPQDTEETINANSKPLGGILHDPQTTPGKYADTAAQFVTGARAFSARPGGGPSPTTAEQLQGIKKNAADLLKDDSGHLLPTPKQLYQSAKPYIAPAATGLASEAAGQVFEGTDAETPARIITAIAAHKAEPYVTKGVKSVGNNLNAMGIGQKTEVSPGVFATKEQQNRAAQGIAGAASNPDQLIESINKGLNIKTPPSAAIEKQIIPANPGSNNGNIVIYKMNDNGGNHVGTLAGFLSQDGKTFTVSSIDGAKGPNNMGVRAVRQFGQQITSDFPDVESIDGRRVTGTRGMQGGAQSLSIPADKFAQSNNGTMLAGSNPTLAEVTPDHGIAQMQDTMRTKNPEAFQARSSEQNTARAQAISGVRGEGNADNVGAFFRDRLAADEANMAANEQSAQQTAAGTEAWAKNRAQTAGQKVGGYGNLPSAGVTGDVVQDAQAWRKENASTAWGFLDPYKTAVADHTPVIQAVDEVVKGVNKLGGQKLLPVEKEIYDNISTQWPGAKIDFDTLKHLRTTIGEAQRSIGREYGSESTPMRRLQILKNSVDQAVENTVKGIVKAEDSAVASGKMAPENTLKAKIDAEIRNYQTSRYLGERQSLGNNAGSSTQRVGYSTARAEGLPRTAGAESAKAGRSGAAQGNQGVPKPVVFGEEQQKQYENARAETFRHKTLSEIEKSGAVNPDGTLNAAKYEKWYAKNKARLNSSSEFRDELSQWHQQTVNDLQKVENAQQMVDDLRASQKAQRAEFNKSRAAALINNDPLKEVGRIFSGKNPQQEFSDLVRKVKGSPEATEGLKAAVGDYILKNIAKADLDETGGRIRNQQAYRNFVATHNRALKSIFGGQGLQNLEAVASDIRRTQQWNERAKIPGQSNTAKDALQVAKHGKLSILGKMIGGATKHAMTGGMVVGEMAGGHPITGAMLAVPAKLASAFKSAGLDTVEKIQLEMMMNPSFARVMLKQLAADKIPVPVQKQIATSLMIPTAMTVANQRQQQEKGE